MPDILSNHSLKSFNTFGIDVKAASYVVVDHEDQLSEIVAQYGKPKLVLGGGSNMLLTEDIGGLVLHNQIKGIDIVQESEDHVRLRIGGGEVWHDLVMYCIENGYAGIENLALIPGCVGAAPIQNIGAYGVELEKVFKSLETYEWESGEMKTFQKEECEFGYRDSIFKRHAKGKYFIHHVSLRLSKHADVNISYGAIKDTLSEMEITEPGIKDVATAVIKIRQSKLPDPAEIGNGGSFFKNPVIPKTQYETLKADHPDMPSYRIDKQHVKIPAGWLIDKRGWKGKREGDAGVHDKQALVMVNHGAADGAQVRDLALKVKQDILDHYGIELEVEVNIL